VREVPKPLLEVAGAPFLVHQLRLLASFGATEAVLCVGYRGELIEQRIGKQCAGIRIVYSYDAPGLEGTLGAIRRALGALGERFLVLYGDTYLRIDYGAAAAAWIASGLPAMMTVLRNEGRWDVSNTDFDGARIVAYDKHSPTPAMHWIDYGLGALQASAVASSDPANNDLAELYHRLAERGLLFGFEATERFYEIGTPAALAETERFLRTHLTG
jgi:NDP-sugar pyrophosphorylase family protein